MRQKMQAHALHEILDLQYIYLLLIKCGTNVLVNMVMRHQHNKKYNGFIYYQVEMSRIQYLYTLALRLIGSSSKLSCSEGCAYLSETLSCNTAAACDLYIISYKFNVTNALVHIGIQIQHILLLAHVRRSTKEDHHQHNES